MFELGYLTAGGGLVAGGSMASAGAYLGSSAVSIVASQVLPSIPIYQNNNFSLSFSPTFSLQGMGASLNASYSSGDWSVGAGIGYSGNYSGGFETRTGGGISYYNRQNEIGGSFALMHFGGTDKQNNLTASFKKGEFSFSLANDIPFSDKFRTAAAEIGYGNVNVGLSIYTSDHGDETDARYANEWASEFYGCNGKGRGTYINGSRIYSAMYVGFNGNGINYRFGIDSPVYQDIFQNGIHRRLSRSSYLKTDYNSPWLPYFFMSSHNPYTLY